MNSDGRFDSTTGDAVGTDDVVGIEDVDLKM